MQLDINFLGDHVHYNLQEERRAIIQSDSNALNYKRPKIDHCCQRINYSEIAKRDSGNSCRTEQTQISSLIRNGGLHWLSL
jgi:hypothetical protein